MIVVIRNIISISTIFIMLGSIYARFIKNTIMIKTLIDGVFSLGMSLLIFIFFKLQKKHHKKAIEIFEF